MQASAEGKFTWTMPSAAENLKANFRAAENIELVKIRATDQVAINIIEHVSCKFVKFVGHKNEGLSGTGERPYRLNSAQNK